MSRTHLRRVPRSNILGFCALGLVLLGGCVQHEASADDAGIPLVMSPDSGSMPERIACSWRGPGEDGGLAASHVIVGGVGADADGGLISCDMFQTFFVPPGTIPDGGSALPGSFGLTVKRLTTPVMIDPVPPDLIIDLYDLGVGWGIAPDNEPPIPAFVSSSPCASNALASTADVPATLVAEARLAPEHLVYDADTPLFLNFVSPTSGPANMVNGHWYGLWIFIPSAGAMKIGITRNDAATPIPNNGATPPVASALWTRQERDQGESCQSDPLWAEDAFPLARLTWSLGNP